MDDSQLPAALLRVRGGDAIVGDKRVGHHAERPLWLTEFGVHQAYGLDVGAPPSVEVPPTGAVRDEIQRAVRRPLGLEDRFAWPAGNLVAHADQTAGVERADP